MNKAFNICQRLTNEDHEGNGLGHEEVDGGGGIRGTDHVALGGVARSRFLDGIRDVVDLGIFS